MNSNEKNYLIVVREDFCLNGQVVENEYGEHLYDSEDIDIYDYDMRDFFGEFVLGIYRGVSEDDVVSRASKSEYVMEEMLRAYELARVPYGDVVTLTDHKK